MLVMEDEVEEGQKVESVIKDLKVEILEILTLKSITDQTLKFNTIEFLD